MGDRRVHYDTHSFDDIWLSGKVKLVGDDALFKWGGGWLEAFAFGVEIDDSGRHQHSVRLSFLYKPYGELHEHRKIGFGVKVPYACRKTFSSSWTPFLVAMWTLGEDYNLR